MTICFLFVSFFISFSFSLHSVQLRGGDLIGAAVVTDEVRDKAAQAAQILAQQILTDPAVISAAQNFVTTVLKVRQFCAR